MPGGGGHAWLPHIDYDKIRSTSGRYTSYWNAFLFLGSSHTILYFYLNRPKVNTQKGIINTEVNLGKILNGAKRESLRE